MLIIFKKKNQKFPQKVFDNIFLNIEYHIRELGHGDVTVNKKMKLLTRIFYDILLKVKTSEGTDFSSSSKVLERYLYPAGSNNPILITNLTTYFNAFYNFCFELKIDSMLKGQINFKHSK